MKQRLLNLICCPDCHGYFSLSNAFFKDNEIISGSLFCLKCNLNYPIIDGLPVILKEVGKMGKTQEAFGKQWVWQNLGRFEEGLLYGLSEEEELLNFYHAFDISESGLLSGKFILDAGCGSGRLTKNIGRTFRDSTVIGFDISDSAKIAFDRCQELKNVHIIKCDLLHPPFRSHLFDYIWCEGVIHHTPNVPRSFSKLVALLSSNGKLYIWVYPKHKLDPYTICRMILWKPYFLPTQVLYGLSWVFALPLYLCYRVLESMGVVTSRRRLTTMVFCLFDALSPEFRHRCSKEEVRNLFDSHGFAEAKFIGDIAAVGNRVSRMTIPKC